MRDQCSRCVLDVSAQEITFDSDGVCNFCYQAQKSLKEVNWGKNKFLYDGGIPQFKTDNQYDCLIGLSGGVDSSFMLHELVKRGIRPLCYTVDNGWNDPKADENIMRLVETLKVPFYRYNIDLEKFRKLQSAFMKAGVKNIEIPTDHILMATALELADKYKIKWIMSGGNVATESIMPASWGYNARDLVHIKDIYKKMTGEKLKGLPVCSLLKWNWYKWVKGIKTFYPLDYLDYKREEAIKILEKEYGWKSVGEKHCESIFTWWFQNWYLFEKFGIDKRKAHLSSLINSGQMTREKALEEIYKNPVYPELALEKKIMKYKTHEHSEYKTDEKLFNIISKIVKICRF